MQKNKNNKISLYEPLCIRLDSNFFNYC